MRHLLKILLAATALLALPLWALDVVEDHQDLEGPFADGPSVTEACLDCHEDSAEDFMKTSHWTWKLDQDLGSHGPRSFGKMNAVNNFCIAVNSNWPRCTSCHAGYGWADESFDFSDATKVDCLVCHDQTGKYRKFPTGAGHPVYEPKEWQGKIWEPVDLASIARTVGSPGRHNCGACHFNGGGGDNVKHGDLDNSLLEPPLSLDVHMSPDGQNFSCQECHTTENHDIQGHAMFASPGGKNHLDCRSCHDEDVHEKRILNWHGKSLACQTCHVPEYARQQPTKTWWDWSTAGTDQKDAPEEHGKKTFLKKKGTFKWEKNVVPTYAWYSGVSGQYLLGEAINPDGVTKLNYPQGDRLDPRSKIYPFKIMKGKQPYDKVARVIAVPKLFGKTGFWKNGFDWNNALEQGMSSVGLEYSGEYGFAETEAWWRINHMVAPASEALKCKACHDSSGPSRMDWAALGYEGDPAHKRGISRFELKEAYDGLGD
jgi:octaheme c-type cytochrome (tetrathionate reductase family)